MTTLSIIVPCYNVAPYVRAALQSVLDNLSEANRSRAELIIVNDGATDATPKIIADFAQTGPVPTQIINQENAGLSAARNAGMARAQGDYWLFLDSDDVYHNHALDKILAAIDAHTPSIIEFDATVFYGETNWAAQTLYHAYFADIANERQPETTLIRAFEENRWYVWSRCYHRKLFENQTFERDKLFEDFMTVPYLYFAANTIFKLPESLLGYRQNTASITANISHRHLNDIFYGLQKAIRAQTQYPNHLTELHILQIKTWRLIVAYAVKKFLRTRETAYLADVQRFRAQMRQEFGQDWGWQLGYFSSVVWKRLLEKLRA